MSQVSPVSRVSQSRLVLQLTELVGAGVEMSPRQFGERLGSLLDLSRSVALSATLAGLRRRPFEAVEGAALRAGEDFLRVHGALVNSVLQSLSGAAGPSRIRWPQREADEPEPPSVDKYGRFYAAHQREMDARVRGLQERVRDALQGTSPVLAELAALEAALSEALQGETRRLLAGIPALVRNRCQSLREDAGTAFEPTLRAEVQGLLLAEIEVRLLPVQGLVEALEEHRESHSP